MNIYAIVKETLRFAAHITKYSYYAITWFDFFFIKWYLHYMFYVIPILLDILKYFVLYLLHMNDLESKDIKPHTLWFGGLFFLTKLIPFFFLPDENLISIVTGFRGFAFISTFGFIGIFISTAAATYIMYGMFRLKARINETGGKLGNILYLLLLLFLIFVQLI